VRIDYINDTIIIYLKDTIEEDIESLAYTITNKLNKYFNINLKGFYNVDVYIDNNYGTILEFINDARDLYFSKLELNIKKINTSFLYEIEDITYPNLKNIYYYDNKYYIDYYLDNMEIAKINYKNISSIIKNAKKISFCKE